MRVDDIANAAPDPLWRRVAQDAYITATLSMPLITSANIDTALNLYTDHHGGWPENAYDTAERGYPRSQRDHHRPPHDPPRPGPHVLAYTDGRDHTSSE